MANELATKAPVVNAAHAAMYVRMSTEHQKYSTENQAQTIERYAAWKNLVIVKKYVDYGKSGLTLTNRSALQSLLREVTSGTAEFRTVLVYDVSRWGRFQDTDESAYYEYTCKRAHVQVHYCAEDFENDGTMVSTLLKHIKRSMAGEYSRELSKKVFAGQARMVERGYRQGGPAGYGLRRQLISSDGKIKGVLKFGERKSIQSDRVVLIPGPRRELTVLRKIYRLYIVDGKSEREIVDFLNEQKIRSESGRPWSRCCVHSILTNPKYIGTNLFNRKSFKLHSKGVKNPVAAWIYREGAFPAVIPLAQHAKAQKVVLARGFHLSDEQMLEGLRGLLKRVGNLTSLLINSDKETPASCTYQQHFKSLTNAYRLIGFKPSRNYKGIGKKPVQRVIEDAAVVRRLP